MTTVITDRFVSNLHDHLGDDELIDDARSWRKLRRHLIWMSVFQKNVLGDDVHEMLLFVDGKATACDEEIEARHEMLN